VAQLSAVESGSRARSRRPRPTSDPQATSPEAGASDLAALIEAYERSLILAVLAAVGGRQRSAAELLRILPSTLSEKMKRLGIRAQRAARHFRPPVRPQISASLHWSGRVPPGGILEIRGLNGPVRVEATGDERADVLASRRGPRALLAALEVKVVEHARGVAVCSVWQGLAASASRRVERRISRGVAEVHVDILARVPPGVRVVASTFGGDIEVVGLASDVEADAANGRVRFLSSGPPAPPSPIPPAD